MEDTTNTTNVIQFNQWHSLLELTQLSEFVYEVCPGDE